MSSATPPNHTTPAAANDGIELLRTRLMHESLAHLLESRPGARESLPHLTALEAAMAQRGIGVIQGMSRGVLLKICSQLSSLKPPANDAPLQDLMERLMRALEARGQAVSLAPGSPVGGTANPSGPVSKLGNSGFGGNDDLDVSEGSYSEFAAAIGEMAAPSGTR